MHVGLVGIGEMARRMGVTVATLRRWERVGKIEPRLRTLGGHRRYDPTSPAKGAAVGEKTVLYARVSSSDQKDDLVRQEQRLVGQAAGKGWTDVEMITDLGSGMNCRKKGLLRLLDLILHGRIQRLVLENKDRLLRFGADLLFRICQCKGVEVVIVADIGERSFEADLARDVLEIITVFSARLYGSRSAKRKRPPAARQVSLLT
jgi:predicted site-specific integrase-resolvase